jgi:hypothetical protein
MICRMTVVELIRIALIGISLQLFLVRYILDVGFYLLRAFGTKGAGPLTFEQLPFKIRHRGYNYKNPLWKKYGMLIISTA